MRTTTEEMTEAVTDFAEMRAEQLLQEGPLNFQELKKIISEEVLASVDQGINDHVMPLLTTEHIQFDGDMRLFRVDDDV